MRLLVTGARGFIGSALTCALAREQHQVIPISRSVSPGGIVWNPERGELALSQACDAAVHLAGESIIGRWTPAKRASIRRSRVQGTRLLCERLAGLSQPPEVVVCASAVGYYGDRGDERLTEDSASGSGFLAEVCREWEAATAPAAARGIRVVVLRLGVVLSPAGGALRLMLPAFRLGLGGRLGSGRQWMPWITLEDLVEIILFAIATKNLRGPVNAVAPEAVTNRQFTKALGRALKRPTPFPVPAAAARLLLGQLADELLLASSRVEPTRLAVVGFGFTHPALEGALRALLSPPVA